MKEYISREAATAIPPLPKEFRNYQTQNLDDAFDEGWYEAQRCIANIPAADVRPVVRGEWKAYNNTYVCSACGRPVSFWQSNFCPNCGAWMEES